MANPRVPNASLLLRASSAVLGVLCSLLWVGQALAVTKAVESELKGVFLFKVVRFVEWPDSTFGNDDEEFVIGILGKDPIEEVLRVVARGQTVADRTPVVRRLRDVTEAADCQVLFVSSDQAGRVCEIVRGLPESPVLTIGGFTGFCRHGGMMALTIRHNRVVLSINPESYDRSQVHVSARLLQLATPLRPEECE